MKTITTLAIALMLSTAVSAQQDRLQEILNADTILFQIYNHLPDGWTMSIDDTSITVYRIEKYAQSSTDCSNLTTDSLEKLPKNETALIRFLYENKWDYERLFWTRETNDSLNIILASLPQQMGVSHLYDKDKSTRFNSIYTGKTKDEKNKVKSYYAKRNELLQQVTKMPNYNTSTLSLILVQRNGFKKTGVYKYPSSIDSEFLTIETILSDYLENPYSN